MLESSSFADDIMALVPNLRGYARKLARFNDESEDLVQDTIAIALDKQRLFKEGTNLRAWLCTIMHNKVVNDLRKAKHRQAFSINEFAEVWSPEFHVEPAQERGNLITRDLNRCLAEINPTSRKVLLAVTDAKRSEDIARATGTSLAAMRSRLHRGRVRLHELMYGTKKTSLYAPRRMQVPAQQFNCPCPY